MSSIIPGYEYDIFISYRQKDNKHDGWVTEFVNNLEGELESTFKEEISVYFDINPHDGLLETHDVDASLKDKLKCLVFIPIISRTYCDPKSFAWEHEFKAFVELAAQDQFGLKVKLPNGNVASRVLPVRIHDLDIVDIKECESVLGGVLRGIEFIYKESGIDKPLSPEDDAKKNLNNTKYRIQIIKVVHAIKEIILGMKIEPVEIVKSKGLAKGSIIGVREEERTFNLEKPAKAVKLRLISIIALVVILIITTIFIYPKTSQKDSLDKLRSSGERISIAVMPFQNMTNDTIWNVWQDGIQTSLITSLSNSEEFKVRQIESTNSLIQKKGFTSYASITSSVAGSISKKLDASVFIYGSINKAGSTIRLNAQLINSGTEEIYKTFEIDGPSDQEMILPLIDSLRKLVRDYLIIEVLKKKVSPDLQSYLVTSSVEAFKNYINGQNAMYNLDYPTAVRMLSQAIASDSSLKPALIFLSMSYYMLGQPLEARKWYYKLIDQKDLFSVPEESWTGWLRGFIFGLPDEGIKSLKKLLEIDDQSPTLHYTIGHNYGMLNQYNKAIPELEKALEIYKKWESKPAWIWNYWELINDYHITKQFKKEQKLIALAEQDFPDNIMIIQRKIILALTYGNYKEADNQIARYITVGKEDGLSEAVIKSDLAGMYFEAAMPEKANEYYRKALSLDSDNPLILNNFAFFLIDNNRGINEGMELVDKALKSDPGNSNFLDTKGWGLYKQGKLKEAYEMLEKNWDSKLYYDHKFFLHLDAAKKAVAGQKRTDR